MVTQNHSDIYVKTKINEQERANFTWFFHPIFIFFIFLSQFHWFFIAIFFSKNKKMQLINAAAFLVLLNVQ